MSSRVLPGLLCMLLAFLEGGELYPTSFRNEFDCETMSSPGPMAGATPHERSLPGEIDDREGSDRAMFFKSAPLPAFLGPQEDFDLFSSALGNFL